MINAITNSSNDLNKQDDSGAAASVSEKLAEIKNTADSTKPSMPPLPSKESSFSGGGSNKVRFGGKKKLKTILGAIVLLLILIGSGAGFYLSQQTQDLRQQAYGTGCDSCVGSCGSTGCNTSCDGIGPHECGIWTAKFMCNGRSRSGCNNANGTSNLPSPFDYKNNPETWCKTYQFDSNAPNGAYSVVFVGNNGEVCKEHTSCDPDKLDWDCNGGETSCTGIGGTITNGTTSNQNTQLTYNTSTSGSPSRVTFVVHGNFAGPGWGTGWVTYEGKSGSKSYAEMVTALKKTGHNEADLLSKGIMYVANVYGPHGFCKGDGQWSDGSGACGTNNPKCNGVIKLAAQAACKSVSGSIVTGKPATDTTNMSYNITSTGDVKTVKFIAHGNYAGPGWSTGWVTINSKAGAGSFAASTNFKAMADKLVASGKWNRAELYSKGITWFANVEGPNGFCRENGVWSNGGGACTTFNPKCNGTVVLPPPTYKCNSSCTTTAQCETANANYYCHTVAGANKNDGYKCRLKSNPTSLTCTPEVTLQCNDSCTPGLKNDPCTASNAKWSCDKDSKRCRLTSYPSDTKCEPPQIFGCNSSCSTDTQCSTANPAWSCESGKCRLTSNPSSSSCKPKEDLECNDDCDNDKECEEVNSNWTCHNDRCRLESNPSSSSCKPKEDLECNDDCDSNSECRETNPDWSCVNDRCRLTSNPSNSKCEPPTGGGDPECNDPCESNSECRDVNSAWSCINDRCRLTSNPSSSKCKPATAPMCLDVAILDEDGNEINPKTSSLEIGDILRFRCAADDPDDQLTRYEYKVTEPDGNVVDGDEINPGGLSPSLEYQITQYLEHKIQCRACTDNGCQDYIKIN